MLQIGAGFGTVEPEHWEISPNGLMIEGTVRMQVFYMVSSDSAPVGAMESLVPFQCQMEMQDLDETCEIEVRCTAKTTGKTGVEMEALTGVNVTLLTIYDMCKAVDKGMEINEVHLLRKSGGKSGLWERV